MYPFIEISAAMFDLEKVSRSFKVLCFVFINNFRLLLWCLF